MDLAPQKTTKAGAIYQQAVAVHYFYHTLLECPRCNDKWNPAEDVGRLLCIMKTVFFTGQKNP